MADEVVGSDVQAVTPWFADKAFIGFLIHLLAIVTLAAFHIQLNEATLLALVSPLVAYIGAHKWKSGQIAIEQVRAEVQKRFVVTPADASLDSVAKGLDPK